MRNIQRLNTFLVEMVIVILFFALSASVTLQLFVAAHNKSVQSQEINIAGVKAQEVLEAARGAGTDSTFTKTADGALTAEYQYDAQWNAVQQSPGYIVKMQITSKQQASGAMRYSHVDVVKVGNNREDTIYQLDAQKYEPAD